jgi:hypothetical protein
MLIAASLDPDDADTQAATALSAIDTPRQLAPLPIQGVPGWDTANECAAYYANEAIFRPA